MVLLVSEMLRPVNYAAFSLQRAVIAFVFFNRDFARRGREPSPVVSVPEFKCHMAILAGKALPQILDHLWWQHVILEITVIFRQQHQNIQGPIGKTEIPHAPCSRPCSLDSHLASLASNEDLRAVFP